MKSTSNYIVYVVAAVVVLAFTFSSCKDQFDINVLRESPKMVVYCFPSTADTTFINVSRSIPVQQKKIADEVKAINNARISYRINRQEQVVRQKRSGQYYVTSLQRPGDQIDLAISADGIGSVYASTTIPKEVPIVQLKMQEVRRYDYESGRAQKYIQMQPTFTDDAASADYYAVSVSAKGYFRKNGGLYQGYLPTEIALDSAWFRMEINSKDEPLLKPLSDLDSNFGFESGSYNRFYIFDDKQINGQTYTMHLNVSDWFNDYQLKNIKYFTELYCITRDYYLFIKSLNDAANNGLARVGLAQISPIYSNIVGGIGLLGAYTVNRKEPDKR